MDDPRGGVRFVIPERGDYRNPGRLPEAQRPTGAWRTPSPPRPAQLSTGEPEGLLRHLRSAIHAATEVRIVAAFVQDSGVDELAVAIAQALQRGTSFRVVTGDYLHITQAQALRRLHDWSQRAESAESEGHGSFRVRVVETTALGGLGCALC